MRAIPECFRRVIMTRCYTNPRLLLTLPNNNNNNKLFGVNSWITQTFEDVWQIAVAGDQ